MKNKIDTAYDQQSECAVSVKELKKKYRKCYALNGLTVDLHAGQMIGLIGANGSGKTTLFRILSGQIEANSGSFSILGGDPMTDIRVKNEMIYSMHNLPVGDKEKLNKVLQYYQIMYPKFDMEFAEKLLKLFDLSPYKTVNSLSQGMKSLFHFSCALATRCQVTMLDEPFIGVDIKKRKMVYEILLREYMEYPRTFIISSHNLSELEGVLSEMVLIDHGQIIFYEDIDSVREMLFRIDGSQEEIQRFGQKYEMVSQYTGEMGTYGIIRGSMSSPEAMEAHALGMDVNAVSPEDVCVYLTGQVDKAQIDKLWKA